MQRARALLAVGLHLPKHSLFCAAPAHVWLVGDHSAAWPLPQRVLCVATTAVFHK